MNPLTLFAPPIEWLITEIYKVLSDSMVAKVGALGVAVIATTLVIRTILFPLFAWQLRTSRRMQEQQRLIGPLIADVRKKYRGQTQKMTAEMQKVYKEHGMSPYSGLSGCLPLVVQLPVIYSLYNGINAAVKQLTSHGAHPDLHFLWVSDVSQTSGQLVGVGKTPFPNSLLIELAHPVILIIPLLAAIATFVQSRMMMQPPRPNMTTQEQSMQNLSRQMSFIMPVMIFVLALGFPVGIALYWVTQSAYMVIQQYYMLGWGGMKVPAWMPGSARMTSLSYKPHSEGAAGAKTDINNAKGEKANEQAKTPISVGGGNANSATARRHNANRSTKARKRRR